MLDAMQYHRRLTFLTTQSLLIAVAAFMFAPGIGCAQDDERINKDGNSLQGDWKLIERESNGRRWPSEEIEKHDLIITFKGLRFFSKIRAGSQAEGDFLWSTENNINELEYQYKSGIHNGERQLAIYEIKGDLLKICVSAPNEVRPTEFKTTPYSHRSLGIFKRIKTR